MRAVYVTRSITEEGVLLLRKAGYEVDVSDKDGALTKNELITVLSKKPYDAVVCLLTDTIDAEVFDAAPSVKIFANYAVGYDNIDLAAAKERGVAVTNTPGVLTEAVAEHTFALIMALVRRIPEADAFARAGKYRGWDPMLFLGTELKGKTLGLIGTGRIGSRVGEIAMSFGMQVACYDVTPNEILEHMGASFRSTLSEVLNMADVVSLHVPLTDSTHHLIDATALSCMKPHAVLVNTARGPVIDEEALVGALQKQVIRGAALDVFEKEPELAVGLAELENVILTPHIASATHEARASMSRIVAENVLAYFAGDVPPNLVAG